MITTSDAKKGKSIEELFSKLEPGPLDEQRPITVSGSSQLERVIKTYQEIVHRSGFYHGPQYSSSSVNVNALKARLCTENHPLTPAEINAFLQMAFHLPAQEQGHYAASEMLGKFTSWLIKQSYRQGYRYFPLNVTNALSPVRSLGWEVQGTEEHPLHLFITGDVSSPFGDDSQFVMYTINGNLHCRLNKFYNPAPRNNLYVFYGEFIVDVLFLTTEHSVGDFLGVPQDCVFKTSIHPTAWELRQQLPDKNIVYLIDPDGRETMVRDYHDQKTR